MITSVSISVIISTRNRARYLPEVLGTLAAQQCEIPFEVIVVDNGSTDDTSAVLEAWCRKDPRFRTTSEPRPGLSRGKNAGVKLARAPLLLFTDDDMRVEPQWVASYHRLFLEHPDAVIVAGGPIMPIPHDLGEWPAWFGQEALPDAGMLHYHEERALREREDVWGGNMAARRILFERFGMWNEEVGLQGDGRVTGLDSGSFEDTELQDRVRQGGGAVLFCPGAVVRHRVDRQTVTPRRLCATAFTRGRIAGLKRPIPLARAPIGVLALAGGLARWGILSVGFRVVPRWATFERVRCAAYSAGHALDALRANRPSGWLSKIAGRIAFPARRLILRLTPDAA